LDPISIIVEIELATLVLAGVGAFATWAHQKSQARAQRQRERQHQELKALHERHHAERMQATNGKTNTNGQIKKRVRPVQRSKTL
jgi:ATPase subunit of ABC transporter with duplicated ATPase domains